MKHLELNTMTQNDRKESSSKVPHITPLRNNNLFLFYLVF